MYEYNATVDRVVDGDTLDAMVDLGFDTWKKVRIRFLGIDATEASVDDDLSTLPVKTDVGYSAYPYTEAVLSGNEFKYNKSLTNSPNREGLIWESNFPEIIFSWRPEGQDEDYGLGTKVKANGKIWSWVKKDGRIYEQRQQQGFLEKNQRGMVFWVEVI